MKNIKLTIEYDGTDFNGWQIQPNQRTIQDEIQKAVKIMCRQDIKIYGAGRTDAGVHAKGQVANFHISSHISCNRFAPALNSILPKDIVIKKSIEVDKGFHSRYSAVAKEYKYIIYNDTTRSSILRNYSYYVNYNLDIQKMQRASKTLIGTYDFKTFMSSGSSIGDTVRTIYSLNIESEKNIIEITIKGNGFLYNMVRIIVGTLIDIARGKIQEKAIKNILYSKNRETAGHTAPAQGLYLQQVFY